MAVRHDPFSRIINVNWGAGGFVAVGGGSNLDGDSLVFVRIVNGSPVLTDGVLVWSDGLFEAPTSVTFGHEIPTPVISVSVGVNYVQVIGQDPVDFGGTGDTKTEWFNFAGQRLGGIPVAPTRGTPHGTTIHTDGDGSRVLLTTTTIAKYTSDGALIWTNESGGAEAWSISPSGPRDITLYLGGTNWRYDQDGNFLGFFEFDITLGSPFLGSTFDVARDGSTYSRFRAIDGFWKLAKFSKDGILQWQNDLMAVEDPGIATTNIAVIGDFVVVATSVGEDTPTREFHGSFGAGRLRHDHLKIYNASGALVSDTLWGNSWVIGTSQAPIQRAFINAIRRPKRVALP